MRTRTGRLLVGVAVVAALASGCGSGPSRVDAAAVIGQDTLALSDVQPRITQALSNPTLLDALSSRGYGPPDVGRAVVNQMILHDLLERAAAEQGIVVRDDEVDAAIAAAGGEQVLQQSAIDAGGVRDQFRDQLIATRIAERQLDRLEITADLAIVPERADAVALSRALAAGGPAADRALAEAPTSQPDTPIRPATTPQAAADPLIGIPAGSTGFYRLSPERGWVVVRVTKRSTNAPPAGDALASRLGQEQLFSAGVLMLGPTADRLGVTLNPRYGVWDPVTLSITPDPSQAGELVRGATAAEPAAG